MARDYIAVDLKGLELGLDLRGCGKSHSGNGTDMTRN
jgi:hypothetical protein